jgi:phosphate transport system substrate-binding protein
MDLLGAETKFGREEPMRQKTLFAVLASYLLVMPAAVALDQNLPTYKVVPGIAGQIKAVGSDTLNGEMELWAKGFEERYPDVKITVEGRGSATAPPALLDGSSQFGPMSRPMTAAEAEAFEKRFGYKVSSFAVAVDALAVYVNKDNPIQCLTMEQVDRIFSLERHGSGGKSIDTWGDVGLTGEWVTKPITMYGRNGLSGTYEFFKEIALYGGAYKRAVKEQSGSEAVVRNVAEDRFAIGYSGIGYKTDGVRAVPLAITSGLKCHDTSAEATYSGEYPIARYLYIYFNKKPNEPIDPLRRELIRYILSKDGQTLTEKGGFYSIPNDVRDKELKRLGLSDLAN